jgi:hypothetical protein
MDSKTKKFFNLAFLFIFLLVTLFINFFHTEKNILKNDNCPACHFLNSSITTSQINFFHLPPLSILGALKTFELFRHTYIPIITPSSRSPPQV